MSDDSVLFSSIRLNGKPLSDCEIAFSCNRNFYRLFFDKTETGFDAIAVEYVSSVHDGDIWDCPELEVRELFHVVAYYDGCRHLEFNRESDMPGYIYYPNMDGLIDMFSVVRDLEKQYCRLCRDD